MDRLSYNCGLHSESRPSFSAKDPLHGFLSRGILPWGWSSEHSKTALSPDVSPNVLWSCIAQGMSSESLHCMRFANSFQAVSNEPDHVWATDGLSGSTCSYRLKLAVAVCFESFSLLLCSSKARSAVCDVWPSTQLRVLHRQLPPGISKIRRTGA